MSYSVHDHTKDCGFQFEQYPHECDCGAINKSTTETPDTMNKLYDPIYKIDSTGKTRVWQMELDGRKFRTIAGIKDGNLVTSEWTVAESTNEGRSNERDAVAQAIFEIEAAYTKKLTREYHRTLEKTAGGAHYFKPMLAQKYEEFERGFAQPKLDGIRCIATVNGLFSREGKPINGVPHIVEALDPYFVQNPALILDGELYNHDLKDDFNTIVSAVKKATPNEEQKALARQVQYHIYDMPSSNVPFGARNNYLTNLIGTSNSLLRLVETVQVETKEDYDNLHGRWLEEGFEGSMHRLDWLYEQKRSKTLLKRKEFVDAEFECVSIEEGLGNWSGMAKRVVCRLPDGREFGAGIKGSMANARALLHETHKIVTVKYFALTPDGIPRFPVAIKFHGAERTL